MFTSIAGIPAHPLFVHLAVVSVPVAALVALVAVFTPWGRRQGVATANMILALVSVLSVMTARWSGEAMLERLGLSEENPGPVADHAQWANYVTVASIGLFVISVAWWWLHRGAAHGDTAQGSAEIPAGAELAVRVGIAIVAVAAVVAAVIVGHEGAQLVWVDKLGA